MEKAGADFLHFDAMDGHFVPNLSFGPQALKSLRPHCRCSFNVHLAVEVKDHFLAMFAEAGADSLAIHQEGCVHLHRSLSLIKSLGKQAGVAINPTTPIGTLDPLLKHRELLDFVLLMSVHPGFGGQEFLSSTTARLQQLRRCIDAASSNVQIIVDGGISVRTAPKVKGADALVVGTALFSAPHPETEMIRIREAATPI